MILAPRNERRRGVVLLAVLLAIVVASLVAGAVLSGAVAGAETSAAQARATQLRLLGRAGAAAALAQLAEQRESLLRGGAPRVDAEWTLWEDAGVGGHVRLLPWESAAGATGVGDAPVARAEAGRININTATPAMLTAVVGEESATRIVAAREKARFTDAGEVGVLLAAQAAGASDAVESPAGEPAERDEPSAAMGLLTVFSFDPEVSVGSEERAGAARIDLSGGWSPGVEEALATALGEDVFARAKPVLSAGDSKSGSALAAALLAAGWSAEDAAGLLDRVAWSPDPYAIGRVDLNTAPAAVLAAVPGFTLETAAAVVAARDRLGSDVRASIAWPATQGLIEPAAWAAAADVLTVRSMVYTVRVEATIRRDARDGDDGIVLARAVYRAVLDVADATPRLALFEWEGPIAPNLDRARASGTRDDPLAGEVNDQAPNIGGVESPADFGDDASLARTASDDGSEPAADTDNSEPPARIDTADRGSGVDRRGGRWSAPG